jgi:lipoprotein-anchoring transpeptidase ErfK/SrfK
MVAEKIAFVALVLSLSSCAMVPERSEAEKLERVSSSTEPVFTVHEEVYRSMKPGNGSIAISLAEQRLTLRDENGRLAVETDCSTGIEGRETPTGTFRIKDMIVDKRSNLYGQYVFKETGEVVVAKSWEVDEAPAGTEFRGTAMPYWMRLTWGGVGIHVGKFPRGQRSSFGCIRMPAAVQPLIYQKCDSGMAVRIRQGPAQSALSSTR